MKIKKLIILLIVLSITSVVFAGEITKKEIINYFNQLVFGSEFGSVNARCKKWAGDIRIFVIGRYPDYLDRELDKIIGELNQLIKPVKLVRVTAKRKANYAIFFGSGLNYVRIESNARSHVGRNLGLFWVYWDANKVLNRGSMYVDIFRTQDKEAQKHLLREELTQSLGIMKDSYKYPGSIFQQKWTFTTAYSKIDRQVIRLLYNRRIKPGMTGEQVNTIIRRHNLPKIE